MSNEHVGAIREIELMIEEFKPQAENAAYSGSVRVCYCRTPWAHE